MLKEASLLAHINGYLRKVYKVGLLPFERTQGTEKEKGSHQQIQEKIDEGRSVFHARLIVAETTYIGRNDVLPQGIKYREPLSTGKLAT